MNRANIELIAKFESFLTSKINEIDGLIPEELFHGISYSVFSGGKRIRPLLLLASAITNEICEDRVLPLAVSLELIHSYSLVHDDLPGMDNAITRRGKPSVYAKFGEGAAILIGDALLNFSFENMLENIHKDTQLTASFLYIAKKSGILGMITGQFLDMIPSNNYDRILDIYNGKTCALFEAALTSPLYIKKNFEKIYEYEKLANIIGKIFQLKDDINDHKKNFDINNLVSLKGENYAISYLSTLKEKCLEKIHYLQIQDSILANVVQNYILYNEL